MHSPKNSPRDFAFGSIITATSDSDCQASWALEEVSASECLANAPPRGMKLRNEVLLVNASEKEHFRLPHQDIRSNMNE